MTGGGRPAPDVRDTVVVTGGTGPTAVETQDVRHAGARASDAAQALGRAAAACRAARADLDAVLLGGPSRLGADPVREALADADVRRWARVAASHLDEAGERLRHRAAACELDASRLLRAAGLYEEAEAAALRAVGGGPSDLLLALRTGLLLVSRPESALLAAWTGIVESPEAREALVAGVSWLVTGADPRGSGGDRTPVGAARSFVTELEETFGVGDRTVVLRPGDTAFPGGAGPAWRDRPATDLVDAVGRITDVEQAAGDVVTVQEVTHADGTRTWVVVIPGMSPALSATEPNDMLTNLELVGGLPDEVTEGVQQAMEEAGVPADEQVVLLGHSQGGIAAMALAGSAVFRERFRLGGVVTVGSPVAHHDAGRGVPVLHVEHTDDLVPSLDGRSNPATPDRVTVRATPSGGPGLGGLVEAVNPVATHGVDRYTGTLAAALALGDPRLAGTAARIEPMLTGVSATTTSVRLERDIDPDLAGAASTAARRVWESLPGTRLPTVPLPVPLPGSAGAGALSSP